MLHILRAVILICALARVSHAAARLGAEFSLRPVAAGLCDVVKQAVGSFLALNGSAAAADASGWPLEDAYIVVFDEAPVPGDPAAFVPRSIYGRYSVSWQGNATLVVGPGTEAVLSDVTFDVETWVGSAAVTLVPSGGALVPGLVLGFADTVRVRGGAVGSGIANLTVRPPGCATGALWHPALLAATAPFTQVRLMEWTGTNALRNFSRPDRGVLEWADRTQLTDAVWGGYGAARDGAVGAPWETAVLLAQALAAARGARGPADLWIAVPIYASADFVRRLASLLHRGTGATGGAGLPAGGKLYIELGNEVWLNGTEGGPGSNYMWNLAAAEDEVTRDPTSALAAGGATDPQVWARRRHVRELLAVAAVFGAEWGAGALRTTVLPVLGSFAAYAADVAATLTWARDTLGADPASTLASVAVNCYVIAGFPAGTAPAAMPDAWLAASDALTPARRSMAAVAGAFNLALVSYEGAPVGIAVGEGAAGGPTTDAIIAVQRSAAMAPVLSRDLANWQSAGGAAYNYYALASAYGPPMRYQWGLVEDLANLTAPKYDAVLAEMMRDGYGEERSLPLT